MPGTVRPVTDERDGLLAYLAQQRDALRFAVHGLTDEQARAKPIASSAITLGGLVKHAAFVERGWIVGTMLQRTVPDDMGDWESNWRLGEDETLASALDRYAAVAAETEQIVAGVDLSMPVPVPRDAPWFPKDVEAWSARWVLLHVIEETARHAGHADILREAIDGQTAYVLMAAAEGWDISAWMSSAES